MSASPSKRCWILCGALLLGGCATTPQVITTQVSKIHYAPTSLVEVLSVPPTTPYTVIAKIHGEAPAGTPSAQVIASIQKQAAALGADAIVLQNESKQTPAQISFNPSGGNYISTPPQIIPVYECEAIHFTVGNH